MRCDACQLVERGRNAEAEGQMVEDGRKGWQSDRDKEGRLGEATIFYGVLSRVSAVAAALLTINNNGIMTRN